MAHRINTNVPALNAQKNLGRVDEYAKTAMQRLSSGKRINSAKDDAAGLAIVARMTSQLRGTNVAIRNTNDGVSLAQVAEGALSEKSEMLQRVRELAVQSANATNSASDRKALQEEVGQLKSELNRIAKTSEFNGKKLLDGSAGSQQFQVGANPNQTITATSTNFKTDSYGNHKLDGASSSVGATDRLAVAGTVDIQSSSGTTSVNYQAGDSAKQVAENVNQNTDQTGVKATAKTDVSVSFSAAGSYTLEVKADNQTTQTVSFNLDSSTGVESLQKAADAFNDQSSKTGVTAKVNDDGSGITLTHSEGETVTVSDTNTANAGDVTVSAGGSSQTLTADTTADTAVATGEVSFSSNASFTVADSSANAVLTNTSEAASLRPVADLDVSTVDQANDALAVVDAAIAQVSQQRAEYGALQNRFESTVRNSENYGVNLSAARSRIEDADYAKEAAELTRTMILKQAGIAMLGQANTHKKVALSLLSGNR